MLPDPIWEKVLSFLVYFSVMLEPSFPMQRISGRKETAAFWSAVFKNSAQVWSSNTSTWSILRSTSKSGCKSVRLFLKKQSSLQNPQDLAFVKTPSVFASVSTSHQPYEPTMPEEAL